MPTTEETDAAAEVIAALIRYTYSTGFQDALKTLKEAEDIGFCQLTAPNTSVLNAFVLISKDNLFQDFVLQARTMIKEATKRAKEE